MKLTKTNLIILGAIIGSIIIAGLSSSLYHQPKDGSKEILVHPSPYYFVKDNTVEITPESLQNSFVSIVEKVGPAVVNISTIQIIERKPTWEFFFDFPFEDFFGVEPKSQQQVEGTGSGVIIDSQGYVLTNNHVIEGATKIKIRLTEDGKDKEYDGEIVGQDSQTDLAIVKIKANREFPSIPLGNSDEVKVGEWVVAIGSPFGLAQTVTVGIISAQRQTLSIEGKVYHSMLQTDAAINRGNSGGPLVNLKGEVIGINTAIYAPTGVFNGIGFAIPINQAKLILSDLIKEGKVIRGWLGIEISDVDEVIAKQFNLKDVKGVLVNNVYKNSAADKAGIKRGDVIIKFNDIVIENTSQLQNLVSGTKPKEKVKIVLFREGQEKTVTCELEEKPEHPEELDIVESEETVEWLGAKFSEVFPLLAQKYKIPENEKGVVIVEIELGKEISEIGLRVGDLIRSINKNSTPNLREFEKVIKNVDLKEGVLFDVIREGRPVYITYMKR